VFECRHAPYALPASLAAELTTAYSEPQRAYHNMTHIAELLRWFDVVGDGPGWRAPADIYTTLLFHDAIYVPTAKDNEATSAAWARRAIAEHALPADADAVAHLIELTAQHGNLETASGDNALFLDSDMAILGSDAVRYRAYASEVRREYSMVPAPAYRAGRGAFLAAVLGKPRLYFTAFFHDKLDAQARTNLAAEQALLASGALDESSFPTVAR
jgi:predicted metal-dependent HD superfamily phosphohydrolase